MQTETSLEHERPSLSRYTPLIIWVVAVIVGLLIPLKILSLGFLPVDDAMRHVAKSISGKSWPEILVMDERFAQDEHPGWHAILGALHRGFNWNGDALMFFSIFAPFVLFWLVMLFIRKRPEAMLLTLFAASVLAPFVFSRLLFGRPFIVMLILYVLLLHLWTRDRKISLWTVGLSTLLIGFSVWVHGSWYLFGIVVMGFALANEWRKATALGVCWVTGSVLGATLTGHPYDYLHETFFHLLNCFSGNPSSWMLVTELRPGNNDLFFVAILLALIWRVARGEWKTEAVWTPLLILAVVGWILGFKIQRFWTDWGFPAALLWLAGELESVLESKWNNGNWRRLGLTGFAAAGVFFAQTGDVNSRWTSSLTTEYVTPETPGITGWLPEKGGTIYSIDMALFFQTFYKNPTADWRYALGFEPGIMTPDNYEILRQIQWKGSIKAFEAWEAKMRPEDRVFLQQGAPPGFTGLEWHYAIDNIWIGRLPRTNTIPKSNSN